MMLFLIVPFGFMRYERMILALTPMLLDRCFFFGCACVSRRIGGGQVKPGSPLCQGPVPRVSGEHHWWYVPGDAHSFFQGGGLGVCVLEDVASEKSCTARRAQERGLGLGTKSVPNQGQQSHRAAYARRHAMGSHRACFAAATIVDMGSLGCHRFYRHRTWQLPF